jgi:septum formation protein
MRLFLASTSPARLATLRAAGIAPIVVPSGVDEEAAVRDAEAISGPLAAADMVLLLARAKAETALTQAGSSKRQKRQRPLPTGCCSRRQHRN